MAGRLARFLRTQFDTFQIENGKKSAVVLPEGPTAPDLNINYYY